MLVDASQSDPAAGSRSPIRLRVPFAGRLPGRRRRQPLVRRGCRERALSGSLLRDPVVVPPAGVPVGPCSSPPWWFWWPFARPVASPPLTSESAGQFRRRSAVPRVLSYAVGTIRGVFGSRRRKDARLAAAWERAWSLGATNPRTHGGVCTCLGRITRHRQRARTGTKAYVRWCVDDEVTAAWFQAARPAVGAYAGQGRVRPWHPPRRGRVLRQRLEALRGHPRRRPRRLPPAPAACGQAGPLHREAFAAQRRVYDLLTRGGFHDLRSGYEASIGHQRCGKLRRRNDNRVPQAGPALSLRGARARILAGLGRRASFVGTGISRSGGCPG